MGRDRSERQDKSAAEISLKLHKELNVSKEEAFNFWQDYQKCKALKLSYWKIMINLEQKYYQKKLFAYFAALAMEIISKEIIEGVDIDKKES